LNGRPGCEGGAFDLWDSWKNKIFGKKEKMVKNLIGKF
jgi:hypothetical protein